MIITTNLHSSQNKVSRDSLLTQSSNYVIGPQLFFSVLARLPKQPKNRNPIPPKALLRRTGYLDWDYSHPGLTMSGITIVW